MPTTPSYNSFIRTCRSLANQGEEARLELMKYLIEMEPFPIVWRGEGRETWAKLLKSEKLCTAAKYGAFKDALKIKSIPVNTFGVDASTLIAKLERDTRARVIRETKRWAASHNIRPTYQRITQYVRASIPAADRRPSRIAELRTYIATLQALLDDNNIPYPSEP